jgi:hypothetical protein
MGLVMVLPDNSLYGVLTRVLEMLMARVPEA